MSCFVLLTCAHGLLGTTLLCELLKNQVSVVVLSGQIDPDVDARERLVRELVVHGHRTCHTAALRTMTRVRIVDGHIASPRLGVTDDVYASLAANITHIIHCVAPDATDSIEIQHVMELAGSNTQLSLVTNQSVRGCLKTQTTSYLVAAEKVLYQRRSSLIFRPATIIGHSVTGHGVGEELMKTCSRLAQSSCLFLACKHTRASTQFLTLGQLLLSDPDIVRDLTTLDDDYCLVDNGNLEPSLALVPVDHVARVIVHETLAVTHVGATRIIPISNPYQRTSLLTLAALSCASSTPISWVDKSGGFIENEDKGQLADEDEANAIARYNQLCPTVDTPMLLRCLWRARAIQV